MTIGALNELIYEPNVICSNFDELDNLITVLDKMNHANETGITLTSSDLANFP